MSSPPEPTREQLLDANRQLRGALIFAGRHIRRLVPSRTHPVLVKLRQVLNETRLVAKAPPRKDS